MSRPLSTRDSILFDPRVAIFRSNEIVVFSIMIYDYRDLDRDEISWRFLLCYGYDVAKFVVFKYLFRSFLRERIYFYILERLKFFLHVLCYVRRFF